MIPLVSLQYAKTHARIVNTDSEADLLGKLVLASGIVMRHCKLADIPSSWIVTALPIAADDVNFIALPEGYVIPSPPESPPVERYAIIPENITAAILLVMSDLYENREAGVSLATSQGMRLLLESYRDPTMA